MIARHQINFIEADYYRDDALLKQYIDTCIDNYINPTWEEFSKTLKPVTPKVQIAQKDTEIVECHVMKGLSLMGTMSNVQECLEQVILGTSSQMSIDCWHTG